MFVVFLFDRTIYAANISESFTENDIYLHLNHSEFEEIEITTDSATVDGQPCEILELVPDLRKYL